MKSRQKQLLEKPQRLRNVVEYLLLGSLLAAAIIHLIFMTQIGFMSDDYALIANAEKGQQLWNLHYSLLLKFLWKYTAAGSITAFQWHLAVLIFHFINAALLYLITHHRLKMTQLQSLFICACFTMSPPGVEALAWTCSAGYVLTIFWIFLSWNYFLQWGMQENEPHILGKGLCLAFIQAAAFLTWDWGILLWPILSIFTLIKAHYRQNIKLLIPAGLCWVTGALLRAFSHYESAWQHNVWTKKIFLLLGAPFLGLFPNLEKGVYLSPAGIAAFAAFICFLAWAAYRNRAALAALLCFLLSVYPWVNGGNLAGRYFYLSMPFIYIVTAIGLAKIRWKPIAWSLAGLLLIIELSFTYERDLLWKMAFQQSEHIKEAAGSLVKKAAQQSLVIVNLPEAFGPEQMPMRPQVWYSGFNALFPAVTVAKTNSCPYIWEKSSLKRSDILSTYPHASVYEVVYRHPSDWREFVVVPFQD